MTIRRRLSLSAALAVAVAIALASTAAYVAVRSKLRGEVDDSLRARVSVLQELTRAARQGGMTLPAPPPAAGGEFGGATGYFQLVTPAGNVLKLPGSKQAPSLPP